MYDPNYLTISSISGPTSITADGHYTWTTTIWTHCHPAVVRWFESTDGVNWTQVHTSDARPADTGFCGAVSPGSATATYTAAKYLINYPPGGRFYLKAEGVSYNLWYHDWSATHTVDVAGTGGVSVALSGPTQAGQELVTVTATPSPSGSYYYNWYYQFCYNGTAPGDCDYRWYPMGEGYDMQSKSFNFYSGNYWGRVRVELRDAPGGVLGADAEHLIAGYGQGSGGSGGMY